MIEYSANDQRTTTEALEDLYAEHFFAGSGDAADDLSAEGLAHPEGVEIRYLRHHHSSCNASADDGLDCVAGDGDDRGDGFFELAEAASEPGAFSEQAVTLRSTNSAALSADEAADLLAEAGLFPLDPEDPASLDETRDAVEGTAELLAGADASASELLRALAVRGFAFVDTGDALWVPVAVSPDGTTAGVLVAPDGTVRASVRAPLSGTRAEEASPGLTPTPAEDGMMAEIVETKGGAALFRDLMHRDPEALFGLASRADVAVVSGGGDGKEPVVIARGIDRACEAVADAFGRARNYRRAWIEAAEHFGGRREKLPTVQGKLWDATERGGFAEDVAVGRGLGRTRHVVAPGEGGPISPFSNEDVRAMPAEDRAALIREQNLWVNGRRAALASDPAAVGFAARVLRESAATPAGASFKAARFLHPLGPKGLDPRMIRRVALSRSVPAVLRREGARVPANLLALSVLVARTLAHRVLAAAGPNPYGSAAEGTRVVERARRRVAEANATPPQRVVPAAEIDGKRNAPAKRKDRRRDYLTALFAEALKLRSASRIALDTARARYLESLSEEAPSERVRLMLARSEGSVVARSRLKGLGLLDAARELVDAGEASAKRRRSDGHAFLVASETFDRHAAHERYRHGVIAALADPEDGIFVPEGTRLSAAVAEHLMRADETARPEVTDVAPEPAVA